MRIYVVSAMLGALLGTGALADIDESGFVRVTPEELEWQQLEPGLDVAILEGDPGGEGYYILRARFSPGVLSRPHFHPNDRFITVIKGTWWTGIGSEWDKESMVPLGPGSYMKHPGGAPHYDGAMDEEVIVEIRGMGPAPLVYVDSSGEPIH